MDISAAYNFERVPSPSLISRALAFVESRLIAAFTILSRKSGLLIEREDPAGRGCLFVYDSRSIMNPPLSSIAYLRASLTTVRFPISLPYLPLFFEST